MKFSIFQVIQRNRCTGHSRKSFSLTQGMNANKRLRLGDYFEICGISSYKNNTAKNNRGGICLNGVLLPRDFVRESLELHLFFGRIMKEHSIFLEAGFVGKDASYAQQADQFKCLFTDVLQEAILLANGVVSGEAFNSGEWITDKTLRAEQVTQELSGIYIETVMTTEVSRLTPDAGVNLAQLEAQVSALNQKLLG